MTRLWSPRFVFRRSLWSLFFLLSGPSVFAADFSFDATVDRDVVTMNDTVTLQLTVSGKSDDVPRPTLPPLPGFRATPAGQSQNFRYDNGRVSNQISFIYSLAPEAPGTYTLPSFSLESGGQKAQTQPIQIKVVSGGSSPSLGQGAPSVGGGSAQNERDLFVTATVDKKNVTVGEPIVLTFRFYSRAPLLEQPRYQPPDITGFMSEDLPPQRQFVETVNGRPRQVVELQTALFPTAAGSYTIGPAALECTVRDFSAAPPGFSSFFDDMFATGKRVVLRSDPISITVSPIPALGRPTSFRGDVGRYTVSAALDRSEVRLHEPVTLTVTVSGEGNLKSLSAPEPPSVPGIKVYETLNSLNIDKKDRRVRGSKVFTTLMKPDVTGSLTLPGIAFSFFDPERRAFQTVKTSPLSLRVLPGESGAAEGGPSSLSGGLPVMEGVKIIGQDIRYIKTAGSLKRRVSGRARFWGWVQAVPGGVFLVVWACVGWRRRTAADPARSAFRRAHRRAESALKQAASQPSKDVALLDLLRRIYGDYLSDKMGVPVRGLTVAQWGHALERGGVSASTRAEAQALGEFFDRARYTPALVSVEEIAQTLPRLRALIKTLEAEWTMLA